MLVSRWKTLKELVGLATPISLSSMIGFLSSAIGIYMITHLGTQEVAASALATMTAMTVLAMVNTALMGVGIMVGFHRGRNADDIELAQQFRAGFLLACCVGFFGGAIVWFAPVWLAWFHSNTILLARTVGYFHVAAFFCLFSTWMTVIVQFYNGLGRSGVGTIASLIRLPFAVALMYVFIFGYHAIKPMSLTGLVLGQTLGCLIVVFYLVVYTMRQPFASAIFKSHMQWQRLVSTWKQLFKLGWPIGMQYGGELTAMTIAVYMLAHFGANALAAQQIVAQYSLIMIMLCLGISQAASIMIANYAGAGRLEDGESVMHMSMVVFVGIFICFALMIQLFGHEILSFFYNGSMVHNVALHHLAYLFFWVSWFLLFADAYRNLFAFGLRSLQFSQAPMYLGIACLWLVSLPAAYFIGIRWLHSAVAFRLGFSAGFYLSVIFLWFLWNSKFKLRITEQNTVAAELSSKTSF